MKLKLNETNEVQLEEVFNPIVLKTDSGETFSICMRDGGFEFNYNNQPYFAKKGFLEPFHKSVRGNYLVEQEHREDVAVVCG